MITAIEKAIKFPACGTEPLGFYPLVDTVEWIERLLSWGITTAQLRIKNTPLARRRAIYKESIALTRHTNLRLFINDDWPLAIELNAYGVHLGQEDLLTADLSAMAASNLRLGVSTHNENDIRYALSIKPSYIACGPVFPTQSKADAAADIGIEKLNYFRSLITNCPVVAIGGINEQRLNDVLATGVDEVAVINALIAAEDPETVAKNWYQWCLWPF